MYQDTGPFDMKYDGFKEMCRVAWGEKFNYLCIDMTKKMRVNIVFSTRAKTHISIVFQKLNLFSFLNDVSD